MATDIIFKTELKRGPKGAQGTSINFEVPTGSIIAFDGDEAPEGWVIVENPGGGNFIDQFQVTEGTSSQSTLSGSGEVNE